MIKEVCVENFTSIKKAIQLGASRIELCDNLAVGGTTVSYGVAKKAIEYCGKHNVKVMTIVRPRGGNFVYNQDEIEIILEDIKQLKRLGTDGIVIGCLNQKGWIDETAMIKLMEASHGSDVTFHMAFDAIPENDQLQAIDWLANHGIRRMLTHGGPSHTKIEDNLEKLQKYIQYSAGRITIMPGGGVTKENSPFILENLDVNEIHGTKIVGDIN